MKIAIRKRLQIFVQIILIYIICTSALFAQSGGTVFGVITDGSSNTSLPGATVSIKGMSYGTITDPYGKYTLTNISEGTVTLIYSYVGYTDEEVVLEIKGGTTIQKDVVLVMDMQNLGEVVVSAQLLGQTKAINQQLNSDALMNAVSEDKIKDLPDVNAAEAIGRIPGIAIQRESGEGQKVAIRGLEPKFSAITINGVRMASNSSTDKSVDLSLISPELLNGIEVYKSPTPDMDGEAVGGTVNLIIKKAPSKARGGVKLNGAYNSLNSSFGNYGVSVDASSRFFDDKLGIIAQASLQQVDRSNNLLGTSTTTAGGDIYFRYFRLSDIEEVRKRSGASLNLDLNVGQGNISLYTFYSNTKRDYYKESELYSPDEYTQVQYETEEKQIELDMWSTALRGDHKISNVLVNWSIATSLTNNNTPFDAIMDFRDIEAYGNAPRIGNDDFTGYISNAEKDYNNSELRKSVSETNRVKENFSTAFLDLKLPFKLGDKFSGFFKTGAKYTYLTRERDLDQFLEPNYYQAGPVMVAAAERYPNDLSYTSSGKIAASSFLIDNQIANSTVFDGDYPFNANFDRDKTNTWHTAQKDSYKRNPKEDVEDYSVTETVTAAYFMAKLEFGSMFTVIPGFRFEHSDNQYNAVYSSVAGEFGEIGGTFADTTSYQDYNDFLPHLHMTFKPVRWFSLKGSVVKTIARPNYNYISPRTMVDIGTNRIEAGNGNLKHMESMNYDLTASFYNGKYGLLTAGVFMKDMKNIFYKVENFYLLNDSVAEEMGYPEQKGYMLTSYGNSADAMVYGFEIDLQTNLKYMPAPFNGVVMSANFSRLFSETIKHSYSIQDTTYRNSDGNVVTEIESFHNERKITIPGQVPYILNLSVGYDYKGFSCRVSGVFQGTSLKKPAAQPNRDTYSWKFWRWDVMVKQNINEHFNVFANLTNLNLQREESFYNKNTAHPDRVQTYGMIFNLGVQAKF